MKKINPMQCPCGSGFLYNACCQPYHRYDQYPATPEQLMRSRYSAYVLRNVRYIINTTHRDNESYQANKGAWERTLKQFLSKADYMGLRVMSSEVNDTDDEGYVSFIALLIYDGKEASFSEKSRFVKENNKWLYVDGETLPLKKS